MVGSANCQSKVPGQNVAHRAQRQAKMQLWLKKWKKKKRSVFPNAFLRGFGA